MAYTRETERLVRLVRAELLGVTDQQVRDLVAAWADAWNEIAPDLNTVLVQMLIDGEKINRTALLRSTRLRNVLVVIADQLEHLAATANVRILGDLRRVIDIAGDAQASIIDSQLPPGSAALEGLTEWSKVDPAGIDAIVKRSTQTITSYTRPLSKDADTAVRRELVRGYAAGTSPRVTAGRIVARTQGRFNGGLNRALAIARTESLDASRAAAALSRSANTDVLAGWSWHCEMSPRSCPACISLDGEIFGVDEPGPDDHVNGRCTAVPITKSWADLGIDIPEPDPIRQTAGDWFDSQPADVQRQILGPGRFDAWQAGAYPMSDWGHTVSNPGWRDSLQTTRVPDGYRPGQSGGRAPSSAAS